MTERPSDHHSLVVSDRQPLIGVPMDEDGNSVVRYFTEEREADTNLSSDVEEALSLAGSWSDLDWQEMEEALDRIRHEREPRSS